MGEKANKIISLAIDKKLHSSFIVSCSRDELFKFTKYCSSPGDNLKEIVGTLDSRIDQYENKIPEFFEIGFKSTSRAFNILKLFKPGEILENVIHHK